jgi:hypothetical protein
MLLCSRRGLLEKKKNTTMSAIECLRYSPSLQDTGLPTESAKQLNIFITTGLNETKDAVAACCYPNILNFANDCHLWCTLPSKYLEEDGDNALHAMTRCIGSKTNSTNGSMSALYRAESGPASGATNVQHSHITALGIWALMTVGFIMSGL